MQRAPPFAYFVRLRDELRCLPRDLTNVIRFGKAAPRKHQTIYIDPRAVVHVIDNPNRFKSAYFSGLVLDGDWDREGVRFADLWPARCVRSRIREGKTWEETGAYEIMMESVTVLGKADGCRDLADIIARYQRLDSLIQRFKQGGEFISWRQLKSTNIRERGGVFVHVGRNGELLHSEKGNHRLAIAQELGLKWIPAQVGVVHRQVVENELFQRLTFKPAAGQY